MATANGTQGNGDVGSPDPKTPPASSPAFNERVQKLLSEFVGKPVTHALVNELTTRLSNQSGVTSVLAERMEDGIKVMVSHVAEGVFHWMIDEAVTLIKRKL